MGGGGGPTIIVIPQNVIQDALNAGDNFTLEENEKSIFSEDFEIPADTTFTNNGTIDLGEIDFNILGTFVNNGTVTNSSANIIIQEEGYMINNGSVTINGDIILNAYADTLIEKLRNSGIFQASELILETNSSSQLTILMGSPQSSARYSTIMDLKSIKVKGDGSAQILDYDEYEYRLTVRGELNVGANLDIGTSVDLGTRQRAVLSLGTIKVAESKELSFLNPVIGLREAISNNGKINFNENTDVVIPANTTVRIRTLETGETINQGTISNNEGIITLEGEGEFKNEGQFTNNKIIINQGTFLNEGTITNETIFAESQGFFNEGILTNYGKITILAGYLSNANTFTIETNGRLINGGVFRNGNPGVVGLKTFTNKGEIENQGKIINAVTSFFTNEGTITIEQGNFTDFVSPDLTNKGSFTNEGTITNNASITFSEGTFTNKGTVTNNKLSELNVGAVFTNTVTGIFNNSTGGVAQQGDSQKFTINGTFRNSGNFNNDKKIEILDGGEFINSETTGILKNNSTSDLIIETGGSFTNEGTIGGTFENLAYLEVTNSNTSGGFINSGTLNALFINFLGPLINSGNINITSAGGVISVSKLSGETVNTGTITNNLNLVIEENFTNEGTFTNQNNLTLNGTFSNTSTGSLTNTGKWTNEEDSSFISEIPLTLEGEFINKGTFDSQENLTILGAEATPFKNEGTLKIAANKVMEINSSGLNNTGTIENNGVLKSRTGDDSTIYANDGNFGIITTSGTVTGLNLEDQQINTIDDGIVIAGTLNDGDDLVDPKTIRWTSNYNADWKVKRAIPNDQKFDMEFYEKKVTFVQYLGFDYLPVGTPDQGTVIYPLEDNPGFAGTWYKQTPANNSDKQIFGIAAS